MGIELDFNDFSNGHIDTTSAGALVWEGTGVFDELMKAINGNIQVQYDSGRIKGGEYATVYLGSMQAAISEAMKFMLTKDQIVKDLELKTSQIEATEADTLIKQEQHTKDLEVKDKDLELKTQQILSMKNEDSIKTTQSAKDLELKDKDLELKTSQIEATESDTLIKQEQSVKDLELKYVQQIKLDKEAAAMGLDSVVKSMNQNTTPGYIYTPQYKKG